ncbi:UreD urease accessory protein-domain-containing protein [Mycena sp. CBHHK59/15]|nr:UreD urease accessory protein-domain-containing protein [Mycena sp. CBHHK59/15]
MTATAGHGRISLGLHGSDAVFAELSSTYPLKLLSPRIGRAGLAVAYMITYGGGLVSGDFIGLSVDVGSGAVLVLLSQGSTKVFKMRVGQRPASAHRSGPPRQGTTQEMEFRVAAGGTLLLLPDAVTCFRAAAYTQTQRFTLARGASLAALDWVTSGRMARGEEWVFARYYSANEVVVDGRRVARDVLLLQDDGPGRPLARKLAPYSCYATLLLYGPAVQDVIRGLEEAYGQIEVFRTGVPAGLLWSLSGFGDGGAVVRVAGASSEAVRRWLADALRAVEGVVGEDVYRRVFAS